MKDNTTADQQVAALDQLIQIRVSHRLKGWPAERREDVIQTCRLRLLIVLRDESRKIDRPEAYAQRLIDNVINDSVREVAKRRRMVVCETDFYSSRTAAIAKENGGSYWFGMDKDCSFQSGVDDPAEVAARNELITGLTLTAKQRELYDLLGKLGDTEAVAQHLDIPVQTASERISRLRRAIREQVSKRAA